MKTLTLTLAMAIAAIIGIANAATPEHDMSQRQTTMAPAANTAKHEGTGVIKDVNAKAGKVLLAHEAIPSLQWPAMTMWFEMQAPLPADVKAGDRVRFELEQTRPKAWVITHIESTR